MSGDLTGQGWRMSRPLWAEDAERGWKSEIFQEFDKLGRREVEQQRSTYGDTWKEHAGIWLRLHDREDARLEAERRALERTVAEEQLSLQRRDTEASERSADAASRSAAASDRSAGYARLALYISGAALLVSMIAVVAGQIG